MRKLVVTQNLSLDGSIEFLGDWFDPGIQAAPGNEDLLEETRRQDAESDAMLLGRRTFEDFRSYWPDHTDDGSGIGDYLNGVEKYVVSSTMTDPGWQHSTVLGGDWLDGVRALKESDGRDIVVTGSITLTHALAQAGLVEEYRLFLYPAVQGAGRRLFPGGLEGSLRTLESRGFASGVTLLRFAPA